MSINISMSTSININTNINITITIRINISVSVNTGTGMGAGTGVNCPNLSDLNTYLPDGPCAGFQVSGGPSQLLNFKIGPDFNESRLHVQLFGRG